MNEDEHYIIAIDCSYSMDKHLSNLVYGLNNFIDKLKLTMKPNIYLTVCTFNISLKYIIEYKNIYFVNKFSNNEFYGISSTALYDSICSIILKFKDNKDKTKLFILTDGDDNASLRYSKKETNDFCNLVIQNGYWNIVHCHTDLSILNIPTITYNIDDISNIFDSLSI
jgi:hypothetical protein